jgi:hypothetical protein
VRLTPRIVEVFLKGGRIRRPFALGRQSPSHNRTRAHAVEPSPLCRLDGSAHPPGGGGDRPATAALCELILDRRPHPEQGFRSCLGIVRLLRPFGADRLEAAAMRAIEIGILTYSSVRSILDHKLDRHAPPKAAGEAVPVLHRNIRGPRYYH